MKLLLPYIFTLLSINLCGQNQIEWFDPSSPDLENSGQYVDCELINSHSYNQNTPTIEFQERTLFVFTHPQIKKWMTDKHLLECKGSIYKVRDNVFLILNFKINSENAKSSYGDLEQGAKIKLQFDKKNYLYLENIERDKGKVNRTEKHTLYQGSFPISKAKIKELKKNDIFKLGVIWEEGYEEYEVINIDLIKNQLNCLN